jgi:serine/threonine protein kinase
MPSSPQETSSFGSKKNPSLFAGGADALIGKVVDSYEVRELLGETNIYILYGALDKRTRRNVLLGVVHKNAFGAAKNYKRVETKLRAVIELRSPLIFSYREALLVDERLVLIAPSLDYETLEDVLSKVGHLGLERAVPIFKQVAKALNVAHLREVIHQDLKPANILMLDNQQFQDQIMVANFSLARVLGSDGEVGTQQKLTRNKEGLGSPLYFSPEQCNGDKVDTRADLYAMGCLMYETLTGKPPFVGKNALETAYKHINDAPRALGLNGEDEVLAERMEELVFMCLAKDPDERYQSAADLLSDLELLDCSDNAKWSNRDSLYREVVLATGRKKEGLFGYFRALQAESTIWIAGIILLVGVVGFWSWIILKPDNKKFPPFNNNGLWQVHTLQRPRPIEDFSIRENAAKNNMQNIRTEIGENSREYADATLSMLSLYHEGARWPEAITYGKKLLKLVTKLETDGQEGPCAQSEVYRLIAYAALNAGIYDEAVSAAEKSLQLAGNSKALFNRNVQCMRILGDIYSRQNNLEKASEIYVRYFAMVDQDKEVMYQLYCDACAKLGDIERRRGKFSDAKRYYKLSLDWWRAHGKADSPFAVRALYGYALVLHGLGEYKEAEEPLREAGAILKKQSQVDPSLQGAVAKLYLDTLWRTNWLSALSLQLGESEH